MDEEAADLARAAAQRLQQQYPDLPPQVEAAIARGGAGAPGQFEVATAIALSALLLNVAKFLYDIRKDQKAAAKLSRDALRRRVRVKLDDEGVPDTGHRSAVIEAVLDEVAAG